MDELLTDKDYILERIPGKGGWTYALIPEIPKDKDAAFGIVKVKGTIDSFEINDVSLMPYGDKGLFLAVRAEIRRKIGKEEGDRVRIRLYRDDAAFEMPEELRMRLDEFPGVFAAFRRYRKWEQRMCIKWIYSAKRTETVNERIVKTIGRVQRREKIVGV